MDKWDFVNFNNAPTLHRYLYAAGNPLRYYDPTGNDFLDYLGGLALSAADTAIDTSNMLFNPGGPNLSDAIENTKIQLKAYRDTEGGFFKKLGAASDAGQKFDDERKERFREGLKETFTNWEKFNHAFNPVLKTLVGQHQYRQKVGELSAKPIEEWSVEDGKEMADHITTTAEGVGGIVGVGYAARGITRGIAKKLKGPTNPQKTVTVTEGQTTNSNTYNALDNTPKPTHTKTNVQLRDKKGKFLPSEGKPNPGKPFEDKVRDILAQFSDEVGPEVRLKTNSVPDRKT